MFSFFYNLALGLFLVLSLPKIILNIKKYRFTFLKRLFFKKPAALAPDQKVIWIHAVSVGETKAVLALTQKIKEEHKNIFLIISSTTKTGHNEAKKSLSFADLHLFLPLDFSWIMQKLCSFYRPQIVLLVETDFWYHFLKYAKKYQAKIILINGKVSDPSFKRWKNFSSFAQRIFSLIDLFCMQDENYKNRFIQMKVPEEKLFVTGNLKLENKPQFLTSEEIIKWKKFFKLQEDDKIITLASTHHSEEQQLLETLDPNFKYFLTPRHPERFAKVKAFLQQKKIPFASFSEPERINGKEQVILIDTMGLLNICYQLSDLAIVGGSFIKKIGGHNIMEPVFVNIPVFFGPYMHSQEELKKICLQAQCGVQVSLKELNQAVKKLFENDLFSKKANCQSLSQALSGQMKKTYSLLKNYL